MELASIPGIIRTILIIVLVYYIVKYTLRLFLRYSIKRSGQFNDPERNAQPKKEGDVTIEFINGKKAGKPPRERPEEADQVDFEEIKD